MVADEVANHDTPDKEPDKQEADRNVGHETREQRAARAEEMRQALVPPADEARLKAQFAAERRSRERNEEFRAQVAQVVASITPEQRAILARELRKVMGASLADALATADSGPGNVSIGLQAGANAPPVHPDAALEANEAAKIRTAEAGVSLLARAVQTPIPEGQRARVAGEVVFVRDAKNDCVTASIDGVEYHKVGDQWRVHLGNVTGHDQYRWLSKQEAITVGLEPDPKTVAAGRDTSAPDAGYERQGRDLPDYRPFDQRISPQHNPPHAGAQPVEKIQSGAGFGLTYGETGGEAGSVGLDQQGKKEQ